MTRRLALTALLALGLAACQIPQGLEQVVNQGAQQHANEHVTDGTPTDKVLCAIPDGTGGYDGWLIPAGLVDLWQSCGLAWARAQGTECHVTDLPAPWDVSCSVLGDVPPPTTTVTVIDRVPG